MNAAPRGGPGYEIQDTTPTLAFWIGIVLLSLILLTFVVTGVLRHIYRTQVREKPPAPPAMARLHQVPPEPRLQVNETTDLERLRAAENAVLYTYGWVSRAQGKAHIPIERAMALVVERGLPARPAKGAEQ